MSEEFSPVEFNRAIAAEFRANAGRVGGMFEGAPLVLLTTLGRRTGRRRTTPLMYLSLDGRMLVFASNAGADDDPLWFRNVTSDPRVTVEIGADGDVEAFAATALVLDGEERDRLYGVQSGLVPAFAEYQRLAARTIPVVELVRREPGAGDGFLQIHHGLRRDLAVLRERVHAALDERGGAAPDLMRELREHCASFCGALAGHHDNEEGRGFPLLEAHDPGLAPVLDRLRREHVAVGGLHAELEKLLADLDGGDPAHVRAELDRIIADLEAHFAYEEEQLIPALDAVTGTGT